MTSWAPFPASPSRQRNGWRATVRTVTVLSHQFIREPGAPREIAYYNPPAQVGRNAELTGSEHASNPALSGALTADWCSSPPRFVGNQLWVTCQDNGFMALRFTNRSYPLGPARS